jgi:hypothetical protein
VVWPRTTFGNPVAHNPKTPAAGSGCFLPSPSSSPSRPDFPFQLSAFPISAFVSAFRPPVSAFSLSAFQLFASWPVEQCALGLLLAGSDFIQTPNEM